MSIAWLCNFKNASLEQTNKSGKEENKVTIKQASWFIPGTLVCILTKSWERLCNRVKGLLEVVLKVFLGGGCKNSIKECSLLIQQNSLLSSYSYSMLHETENGDYHTTSHTCFK